MTRDLLPLFERIVAGAAPIVGVSALLQGTSCRPPYVVREVRPIAALPPGWARQGDRNFVAEDGLYSPSVRADDPSDEECAVLCGEPVKSCQLALTCEDPAAPPEDDGVAGPRPARKAKRERGCNPENHEGPVEVFVVCEAAYGAHCGRRPRGLSRSRRRVVDLGSFLAAASRLEAASIEAFDVLARELVHHGAPSELARRARTARRDEARHTRTMTALATRNGRRPSLPEAKPRAPARSLEALAIENAREGCVRETYGALLACWQARHATDPAVRAAFERIAPDEVSHAELAHAVDAWVTSRLDARARARVDRARRRAFASLARSLAVAPPLALARAAGLPPPHVARHLLHELEASLSR